MQQNYTQYNGQDPIPIGTVRPARAVACRDGTCSWGRCGRQRQQRQQQQQQQQHAGARGPALPLLGACVPEAAAPPPFPARQVCHEETLGDYASFTNIEQGTPELGGRLWCDYKMVRLWPCIAGFL